MASLSKLKPSLSRILMGAALTVSATAVINAGESKAVDYTCLLTDVTGVTGGTCNNQIGDKIFSGFSLSTGGYIPDSDDNITFAEAFGVWTISTNFEAPVSVITPTTLTYTVSVDPAFPLQSLDKAEANSDPNTLAPGTSTVTNALTNLIGSPLITSGANVGPLSFVAGSKTTTISSTFETTGGVTLNNFSVKLNQTPTFVRTSVPGPLPLLGAGAAFAFSRRLRRRIKAVA